MKTLIVEFIKLTALVFVFVTIGTVMYELIDRQYFIVYTIGAIMYFITHLIAAVQRLLADD